MKSQRSIFWVALLVLSILLAGCAEAAPLEDPAPNESDSTALPDSGAASSEDQVLIERTPVPTATPDPISVALTEFAESAGLSDEVILGLTVDDLIDIAVSVLIVLIGLAIGSLLIRIIIPRLARRLPPPIDVQVKDSLSSKLRRLIFLYLLHVATVRLAFINVGLKRTLTDLYFLAGLLVVTQLGLNLIDLTKTYYEEHLEPPERRAEIAPILSLISRILYAVVIVLAIGAGLGRFGVNLTALAAALGIAGLGFALAAQDTIADAIAGMLILADRPFRVGDRINIDAIGTWGDVVEIGLRTTRIRTRDNRLVIVPNSTISKNEVVNFSYPDPRYRIQTHVGIGYDADFEKARQVMIDAVRNTEGVLQDKPIEALYIEMADSDMKFRVRWWIDSYIDTRRMLDAIHTALQNALDEAGFRQAYPIRELHHQMGSEQELDLMSGLGKPDDIESSEDLDD